MYGPVTAPPTMACADCAAPGEVRVVNPVGAHELCALHAIALLGAGGTRVTLFIDVTATEQATR